MKKNKENREKKAKGLVAEFKKFVLRGNIVDMAVGVIIGSAFTKIVTSLTNDVIMPLINAFVAIITKGKKTELVTILNNKPLYLIDATTITADCPEGVKSLNPECIYINWSNFIQVIIDFILVALVLFFILKAFNALFDSVEKAKQKAAQKKAAANAEEVTENEEA